MLKKKWLLLSVSFIAMNSAAALATTNVSNYQELTDALTSGGEITLTENIMAEGNLNTINKDVSILGQGHVIDGQEHAGIRVMSPLSFSSQDVAFQNFRGSVLIMRNVTDIGHISGNFYDNANTGWGGAIMLGWFTNKFENGVISGNFERNTSGSENQISHGIGGAIFLSDFGKIDSISGTFIENSSTSNPRNINLTGNDASGGAITTFSHIKEINGYFKGNHTKNNKGPSEGGAIHYGAEQASDVLGTITGDFIENHSDGLRSMGGGVHFDGGILQKISGQFDNNYVSTFDDGYAQGGALGVDKAALLKNLEASFTNNYASAEQGLAHGGAVALFDYYNYGTTAQIENINNSSFQGNHAIASDGTALGGAIYIYKSSSIGNIINTSFTDNYVKGNEDSHGGAIYSESNLKISADNGETSFTGNKVNGVSNAIYMKGATLTLNSVNNGQILFNDEIDGDENYKMVLSGDDSGTIDFYNNIRNADITLENTTVNLADVAYLNHNNNLTINSGKFNVARLGLNDQLTANSIALNGGVLNIIEADVDLAAKKMGTIDGSNMTQTDGTINIGKMLVHTETENEVTSIEFVTGNSNIKVTHNDKQVEKVIGPLYKYNVAYKNGNFIFTRNTFNPGVFESDVFAMSSLNAQNAVVKEVLNQAPQVFDYSKAHVWATPYYSDDTLSYSGFYDVDSRNYGLIAGVDSKAYALGKNWTSVYTLFGAYNDGEDKYQGVKVDSKSWLVGLKASVYNGGFYGDAIIDYASHDMRSWTAFGKDRNDTYGYGAALKAGYKHGFDKVELDTGAMLSWQTIEGDDFTSKSGARISTDDYSRLTLTPQVKLGYSFEKVRPYALVRYNFVLDEDGSSTVNNITLPEIESKDYVEYGLGLETTDAFPHSGYAHVLRHDGGREGWSVTAGYRYNF